jgi:hypothetical protein
MTREEIIDCLKTTGLNEEFVVEFYEEMELFAKLVTQKEREACASLCEMNSHNSYDMAKVLEEAIRARGQE